MTKEKGVIDSHIQMPKCVLKRFERNDRFFYYDIQKGFIGTNGHAKSLNTESDYYSQETEAFLRDSIETPFGKLLKLVDGIGLDNPSFHINPDFDTTVKMYTYSLVSRNPKLIQGIDKHSFFFQFLKTQERHDYAAKMGISTAMKQNLFGEHISTLAINKSRYSFVLPISGFYSMKIMGEEHVIVPITPKIALVLVPKNAQKRIIHGDMLSIYRFDEDSAINRLNKAAFRSQDQQGYGYLISPDKESLESCITTHKEKPGE